MKTTKNESRLTAISMMMGTDDNLNNAVICDYSLIDGIRAAELILRCDLEFLKCEFLIISFPIGNKFVFLGKFENDGKECCYSGVLC